MRRAGFVALVALLMLGHSNSAAITKSEPITTAAPEETTQTAEQDPEEATAEASAATPQPHTPSHDHHLQVDGSNFIMGDVPITREEPVEIINRNHVPLRNCKEILDEGTFTKSGLYVVQPGINGGEFVVYCDMTLLGGGWTVIQRRRNGDLKFDRGYSSYQNGFGDFTESFWLGLDKINRLTNSGSTMEAYFGVEAFFGHSSCTHYGSFSVGNDQDGYTLHISDYIGNSRTCRAKDSMSFYNGQKFSTPDNDQDKLKESHCKAVFQGYNSGWWFKNCVYTNLNGQYYEDGPNRNARDGIIWRTWLGSTYSLKTTVIAVRPRS